MGTEQEIVIPEEQQGAAPGAGFGSGIIALLPKLIEIATAILSGAGEVPKFTVRVGGTRTEVGPVPLRRV